MERPQPLLRDRLGHSFTTPSVIADRLPVEEIFIILITILDQPNRNLGDNLASDLTRSSDGFRGGYASYRAGNADIVINTP